MECGYHGVHESVCVSFWNSADEIGEDPNAPRAPVSHAGIPAAAAALTGVMSFNCTPEAIESALSADDVACAILEPALMNCGIVLPLAGFLESVAAACELHGTLLILDEVKTGLTVTAGSAVQLLAPTVKPDMVTLGKSLGGGLPIGAVGMNEALAAQVKSGAPDIVSTTGGNALVMSAARVTLEGVLLDDAYVQLSQLNERLQQGLREVIARHEVPASVVGCGAAKGCLFFFGHGKQPTVINNYRQVLERVDAEIAELCALWLASCGCWIGATGDEEWTISVAHTEGDVDLFIQAFEGFAVALKTVAR